ncbi:MAG: protein kinase [Cyanobacteria bacterium]|nr:protein kinase [Cyanobacteria bacterium GSL.Bin1]
MSQCLNPDCLYRIPLLPLKPPKEQFCERCGSKLLLRERYRAIKPLSAGGFGKTFVAIDEDKPSRSYCVIKQFFPQAQDYFSLEKGSVLFEREAKQLDELGKHPQIPELLAYFTEGNYKYLIQEHISGIELKREQEKFGVFNETKLLQFLYEILLILKFIHARQVIHRDIKPENIIRRSRDQKLVLVDFGAVKDLKGGTIAPNCTIIGSSGYAAPEQWQGKATIASDLYSVGATCIYLLTGVQPSELFDHTQNQWTWQEKLGTNHISEGLSQILDQLLALPLSQRYRSVDEVLLDCQTLDPTFPDPLDAARLAMVPVAAPGSEEAIVDSTADENLKPFSFLNDDEGAFSSFDDTEGSEIETSFSGDLAEQEELSPKIGTIHPTLQKLLNSRKILNPTLKRLVAKRELEYIQVEIQVNSAFKIIEHSDQAKRFATVPELIQVGLDARQGFPELVGLEKIAMEIMQGQRRSLQLKEISREQSSWKTIYFDLYFTCDPGESLSNNRLIILIIEATEWLEEAEKLNVFPAQLPTNHL